MTTTATTAHEAATLAMQPADEFSPLWREGGTYGEDTVYHFQRPASGGYERGLRVSILFRANGGVAVTHWDQAMWEIDWQIEVDDSWPLPLAERIIAMAITHAVIQEYGTQAVPAAEGVIR